MSGIFGYSREAVRVKVKKCEGSMQPEFRKFSVDPQITSFEVLQSILGKAFDIKSEFTICYRTYDVYGHETYLPLLSDWDLDAAFLKAHNSCVLSSSEPCLCLRVDMKLFEETSDDWDTPSSVSVITQFRTGTAQEAKPTQRLPGLIMNQVERTFNMVQRAFNIGEDINTYMQQPPRPPLSDSEFRKHLDPVGQIKHVKELRSVIYLGGIDPSLRKVVWKHILNVYPEGMCGRERMDYIKRKSSEYVSLRDAWKDVLQSGPVAGDLAYTTGMVRKDVLRTDRHHKFYAGSDDNQNIASLFNILTTYALNHPKVSYCQGMSDLASPLLVTMGDESHAYICFCALMTRLSTNFMLDGIAMTQKFTHLAEGIMFYDPEFYNYLKSHQADDLLFCYRWLLLEMKREFAFEDSLRMLEVLWSSLPAAPPEKELRLYEARFVPVGNNETPPISPLVKTPRENAYTKVCALRRQTSSISLASYTANKVAPVKRQNFSLDENVCRMTKNTSKSLDDTAMKCTDIEHTSLNTTRPRSVSPLEPQSRDTVVNNHINNKTKTTLSSSMTNLVRKPGHFRDLKERLSSGKIGLFSSLDKLDKCSIKEEQENVVNQRLFKGKIVRNFNEFLNFASTPNKKEEKRENGNDNFDESSPDDSQEYFPMTTSMTRELRLEMENLDRQVFGQSFNSQCTNSLDESDDSSDSKIDPDPEPEPEKLNSKIKTRQKTDDCFIWENPLHESSKQLEEKIQTIKDEFDFNIINESSGTKSVTPIKLVRKCTKTEKSPCLLIDKSTEINNVPLPPPPPPMTNSCEEITEIKNPSSFFLPGPHIFGGGNPFLMFLCLTVLLQHREVIMRNGMDYNEMAMHFDKMVRKHNVNRVLNQARQMYTGYIKQHNIAQHNSNSNHSRSLNDECDA